ncbi:MAG: phenylacetic acid degradation protein [Bacteroidetes bacterium HGW-Bacteroidetes-2]|jgi:ring-1,2-phenylacetyl-CoA epoxidase subunit PaaE|nr:MAG: phenylacetic acid degradation protein [Bacteroidetes bacterium HGW-Bacteroidetes-2]
MSKFYKIPVKEVYKDTKDCAVIAFDIPKELQQEFAYRQGQHLTLKAMINKEDVRRSYSLCSSPLDKEWKVAVKQIFEGKFSNYVAKKLKAGDVLEIMPPSGNFGVEVNPNQEKTYVTFAAGSGITPILSIIKTHLTLEPNAKFKLFYLNRTAKSIIFKEEIEALRNTFFGRFEIFYFLTKEHRDIELFNGRFTSEKIKQLTTSLIDIENVDECFICGPEEMIFLLKDELVKAGLSKDKIHYELFVTGITEEDKKRVEAALESKVIGTDITILDAGKEFHFTMSEEYDNILDGALAAGADLPFACKGGVCSTCKCRLIEGTIAMKINYALDEKEVAQQLILSCQAVPTSDKIVLDFDV